MGNQFTQKIKLINASSHEESIQNQNGTSQPEQTVLRGSLKMKKISSSCDIETLQNMERDALQIKQKLQHLQLKIKMFKFKHNKTIINNNQFKCNLNKD